MIKDLFNPVCLFVKVLPLVVVLWGCSSIQAPQKLSDTHSAEASASHEGKHAIDLSQVSFIEPASAVSADVRRIIQRTYPIPPVYPASSSIPFHASDDDSRFENLKSALLSDKKYMWAVRGGYGSARLLDKLQAMERPETPKVLIGYSDITFLHLLFSQWGWKSIHGAMPFDLSHEKVDDKNFGLLSEIMLNQKGHVTYTGLLPLNAAARAAVDVQGEVLGGNLTLLCNSLGTPWQIQAKNKILLIEDAGSKGYVTDRNLNHLKEAGVFDEAHAVLFGEFFGGDEFNQYAMQRLAESLSIPVFSVNIFGHGEHNYPVPFGFSATISKDEKTFKITIPYDFTEPQPTP